VRIAALLLVVLSVPRPARACASCGCGDPTLAGIGLEQPYAGRLRGSLELRHRTDRVGEDRVDALDLSEQRLDAQLSFAPHRRITLLATLPFLQRRVSYVNLAETVTRGPGDAELRARVVVAEDRAFAPRHQLALTAGAKLPTAAPKRGPDGALLPVELQPGTGSWDPLVALSYAHFRGAWSGYASVQGAFPTAGRDGFRASRSLRATALVQRMFGLRLGARAGLDARVDGKALEAGLPARDSGGAVAFAGLDLLVSPLPDTLLYLSARLPAAQRLAGFHHEGPLLAAGVAYDY
jgi:hypothetical protein